MPRQRLLLAAAALVVVLIVVGAVWQPWQSPPPPPTAATEEAAATGIDASPKALGDANAPVTIIEYASTSCPACANFHANVLPWLRETFIDSGRVRLEYRDFPTNAPALWGAMLAHCAGPERYFAFLELIYSRQSQWAFGYSTPDGLKKVAKQAGMGSEAFDACMADEGLQRVIVKTRADGIEQFAIEATPSFVIDGEVIRGVPAQDDLTRRIEAAGG